jgi:transposase
MSSGKRRAHRRRSLTRRVAHVLFRFVYQTLRILMVIASAIGPAMPPPPPPPPPAIEMVDDEGEMREQT